MKSSPLLVAQGKGRMLRDLIVHGRSIFARLDAEVNAAAKYEPYPDSGRVPIAEGGVWSNAVKEYFSRSSSDYLRARYDAAVDAFRRREDGTASEQARDFTSSLLHILEDAFALEAEPLKSTPGESVSLDKTEVWDLFVSHASEDKESFVRPLVEVLLRHNLSVWFDSATLKLGDSLRAKIDQGLARSRYGLVVLSPAFFAKNWPMQELNGLVARETASGTKAILPIWHNIDQVGVARVSPLLADRLSVSSDRGLDAVCQAVIEALDI